MSSSRDVAKAFGEQVVFKIHAKKGARVAPIAHPKTSHFSYSEQEFLGTKGRTFKIKNIRKFKNSKGEIGYMVDVDYV